MRGGAREPGVPLDTERLTRAVDRLVGGGPMSVLSDPELDGLLQLAGRLRDELPRDLPDPAFRDALKAQLSGPRPLPRPLPPRERRTSYVAAVGAIAAVLVMAVAVGSLAIVSNDDPGADPTSALGQLTNASVSSLATSTMLIETPAAVLTKAVPALTATAGTTQDTLSAPTGEPTADRATPGTEVVIQPTATLAATKPTNPTPPPSKPTAVVTPPADPTETVLLAEMDLPSVDAANVVVAGPAASGDGEPPSADLVVALDAELPTFEHSAPVYYLAPPLRDAKLFVTDVGQSLGIEGQVTDGQSARHRRELWYADAEGTAFVWQPETGWFAFFPSFADTSMPAGDISDARAVQTALDWLAGIGYPSGQVASSAAAVVEQNQWVVNLPYASLPAVGFDYPVGVQVLVNGAGQVVYAQGYWLVLTHQEDATIVTSSEAWQAISAKQGYWLDGGQTSQGGEFRVDTLDLTYILTLDRDSGELVLQPVVKAEGDYANPDGNVTSRIFVLVKAAKSTD